eukprot:69310-Heterocapsa_arctica.AAC.1
MSRLGGQVVECEAQGRRDGVHHGDGFHIPELWIDQQSVGGSDGAGQSYREPYKGTAKATQQTGRDGRAGYAATGHPQG